MKNVRVKVREGCSGTWWDYGIYEKKTLLWIQPHVFYDYKGVAIRYAKAMAKRIGIKYDPEIIKLHGC